METIIKEKGKQIKSKIAFIGKSLETGIVILGRYCLPLHEKRSLKSVGVQKAFSFDAGAFSKTAYIKV